MRIKGFTLPELIVYVAVFGILATLGYPSFLSLQNKTRHTNEVMDLYQLMQFARYSAVIHNQPVTLCPLDDQQCVKDWSRPVGIFIDPDSERGLGEKTTLLRTHLLSPHNMVSAVPESRQYFQFTGTGEARGTAGHIQIYRNGTDSRTYESRVIVSWSGRARTLRLQ